MASEQQYISKGLYQHAQINNFVSVKDFIFIKRRGKKCLLLRFFNDLGHIVHSMDFTVIQMDASGNILEKTKVKYNDLRFMPSTTYVASEAIVVDEYCTDFRVIFTSLVSERYKYSVRNGHFSIDYIKDCDNKVYQKRPASNGAFSINQRSFGKPRLAALAASLAVLIMAAYFILGIYSEYRAENEDDADEAKIPTYYSETL